MKKTPLALILILILITLVMAQTPESVKDLMARVANWQLTHPSQHSSTDWTSGALYAGMAAWARMSDDDVYLDALLAVGQGNDWQLGQRRYHADDHAIGQFYLAMYQRYQDPDMIKGIQDRFDWLLAHPSDVTLEAGHQRGRDRWWWCDALFMAPPVWAELSAATGNPAYRDFMNRQWWATTDYLYDTEEHLYFRDSNFFKSREANGEKTFWCRGNGWVFGGLVKVIAALPLDYPDRDKYLKLYREMAAKLVSIQGEDGLWRSSLLDPVTYPPAEASGSGFFCYGLAWGVNRGLLDRDTYGPAALKAWQGLTGCVHGNGKLGWVQPIGAAPGHVNADLTEIYGVGSFLLAGTEIYKMQLMDQGPLQRVRAVNPLQRVRAVNPLAIFRASETLSLPWQGEVPVVLADVTNHALVTQLLDNDGDGQSDTLLFQADFAPHQQRWFWLLPQDTGLSMPESKTSTFGRFVPERMDDFAWESDRIAFRMFGKALEVETVSSGVDVWAKRVHYPIINKWYAKDDYHNEHGEGLDFYKVGPTQGCGGLAVFKDGKLYGSRNYVTSRVLANGPIRTIFELDYEPWDAGGVQVQETKRISIDLGSNLSRFEDHFAGDIALDVAVGIALRDGGKLANPPGSGVMSYWEPTHPQNGTLGCGVVMTEPGDVIQQRGQVLMTGRTQPGRPFVYYAGAGWDQSPDFENEADWWQYLVDFAQRQQHPIDIRIQK